MEALVGMKPEKKASVLLAMMFWIGTQGLSKVDCTTEWFCSFCQSVCNGTWSQT